MGRTFCMLMPHESLTSTALGKEQSPLLARGTALLPLSLRHAAGPLGDDVAVGWKTVFSPGESCGGQQQSGWRK